MGEDEIDPALVSQLRDGIETLSDHQNPTPFQAAVHKIIEQLLGGSIESNSSVLPELLKSVAIAVKFVQECQTADIHDVLKKRIPLTGDLKADLLTYIDQVIIPPTTPAKSRTRMQQNHFKCICEFLHLKFA